MTTDTAEQTLKQLFDTIVRDGVVDSSEVETLRRRLYADGVIDRDEANFLFDLNDAVSGRENAPEWQAFFVEAISDHLLTDEDSPGEVDEAEGDWLASRIEGDGKLDAVEKALLTHLKSEARAVHGRLRFTIELLGKD